MSKDWCTGFPEYWYQWYIGSFYIPRLRKVYIGDLCKKHDNVGGKGCAAHAFGAGLYNRNILFGGAIFGIASVACWIKYPKDEWRGI